MAELVGRTAAAGGPPVSRYEPVIGLEVHVQLGTASKIFCGCATTYGAPPNTQVCPICLGYPGALPALNGRAVELATEAALALGCTVHGTSIFARKHYFYPDLPKGYQISQFDRPLATAGRLEIRLDDGTVKEVGITRLHLEEDAGKSSHGEAGTLVDFNRCGTPLIEIVSEPDLRSPREAYLYLSALKQTLQYLDVSDCNMEEGSLRCDANVSLRPRGDEALGVKTEVKNVNSFRYVEDALRFEIERQAALLDAGRPVVHETLLWDSARREARPMRSKEMSHDYRYFPEPDLEPLVLDPASIERIHAALPELPARRAGRFTEEYGLPPYDAGVLTSSRGLADFFEETVRHLPQPKEVSNWIMGEVLRIANEAGGEVRVEPEPSPLPPRRLAALLRLQGEGRLSASSARALLAELAARGYPSEARHGPDGDLEAEVAAIEALIEARGLAAVADAGALELEVAAVLEAHPDEVAAYRGGKSGLLGFFVGKVMARTRGRADPKVVNRLLRSRLEEEG